jgi:fibronectin-binding autotransporter adhesin
MSARLVIRTLMCALAIALFATPSLALQRTWIGGNVDWVDAGASTNWNPNDEPDADDEAIFNSANSVNLGSNNAVNGLTMSGGIDLFTNEFDLTVDGLVQLTGAGTILVIYEAAGSVNADNVTINASAFVQIDGGLLTLDEELGSSLLDINAGGTLSGNGVITFADTPALATTLLVNDGTLTASSQGALIFSPPPVGTLQINDSSAGGRIDLDGAGELGVVNVNRNQTLDLNVPLADSFNGTLNLAHNATFDSSSAWTLAGGSINVNNGFVDGVFPNPDILADVSVIKGGALTQSGGVINVVDTDGTLRFDSVFTLNGGTLTNEGHVVFNANATINNAATFTMGANGSDLTVGAGATVTINQPSFNLDGTAAGTVLTVNDNATLNLNLGDYDNDAATNAFDGTINLNSATISSNVTDAEFVMDGVLNSSASGGEQSLWTGDNLAIGNDLGVLDSKVNISGSQPTQFGSLVRFNSDADVNIADGATMHFLSVVNFNPVNGGNNAEITGGGEIIFSAGVNVNETTTLNMAGGTVDLDGADSIGDTLNIDAPLTINAELLRSFGKANGGGGTNLLDINNSVNTGLLTVNLDDPNAEWTLNGAGVMNLVNDNTDATLLAGSDVNVNGTINITGDVRSTARLDIAGTVNINTAGQPLRLSGGDSSSDPNTLAGGTINGVGLLGADTGKALHGFGTINSGIDFDGTANLRASGGTLTISGPIVDVNILGTADNTGTLNVVNAWETDGGAGGSIGGVVLAGGVLQGGTITNDNGNGLQGHGTITSRVINTSKIIAANGGTMLLQTAANDNDWDGAANTGSLEALSGDLEIRDNATFAFTGAVKAINNNVVFANGFALDFNPGSSIQLEDTATYRSTSSTDIGGSVNIVAGANATIQVTNNFFLTIETGSSTTLGGNLVLQNNNINIEAGATFSGTGAVIIDEPSHVVLDNGVNINALFVNEGSLRPGNFNGIGTATLKDYVQTNDGELFVELIGTLPNQYDRLLVSQTAQIDGYLNIDIDEVSPGVPFNPALGTTFDIISSAFGVTGTFDTIDVSGLSSDKAFAITYLPNAVRLTTTSPTPPTTRCGATRSAPARRCQA